MINLTRVDVAKVLYELAAKVESGKIIPRTVVLGAQAHRQGASAVRGA